MVDSGEPHSSAASGVTQSDQCDICCRDHSDAGIASGEVKYDAVTGDTNRYKVSTKANGSVITPISLATSGDPAAPVVADIEANIYLDACRLIRVDGLWRVATDIQASHVGLIATNDEQGSSIDPATPDSDKQVLYATFVTNAIKAYLSAALPTAGSPNWVTFLTNTLASLFSTQAPDVPSTNPVLASTDGTYRYLHAHGLYIDHLEQDAIDKLNAVMGGSCPSTATDFPRCLLAYLPFSTINVSGLAAWTDTNDTVDQAGTTPLGKTALSLGQGTSDSSTCDTGTFFGGCVTGLNNGYAFATATIGHSNSGIANSIPVSPYELLTTNNLSAAQQFNVSNTSTSDLIYAQVTGPDLTPTGFSSVVQFPNSALNSAINTALTWATNGRNGNCAPNSGKKVTSPNPYSCNTTVDLTTPTTVTVAKYNQPVAAAAKTVKDPCGLGGKNKNTTYDIPGLVCYSLSSAKLSADAAGTTRIDCSATPMPAACYSIASPYTVGGTSKTTGETTSVVISSVTGSPVPLSNTYLNLTYVANGSALGTVDTSTCATTLAPTITAPTACP
jgi:hypothetical protein